MNDEMSAGHKACIEIIEALCGGSNPEGIEVVREWLLGDISQAEAVSLLKSSD